MYRKNRGVLQWKARRLQVLGQTLLKTLNSYGIILIFLYGFRWKNQQGNEKIGKEDPQMRHRMKLKPEPFQKMREGKKTIELRLYDEKRQKVQVGDQIEFMNLEVICKM